MDHPIEEPLEKNSNALDNEPLEAETETTTQTTEPKAEAHKKITISKKTIVIAIIVVVVIALGALAYRLKGLVVAATVNGSPISRLAVIQELEKVSGKNTLEALINQKLIADEATKKNVAVGQDEIDTEIKNIDVQLTAQGQKLDQVLEAENMTRADLEKQIMTQKKLEKLLAEKTQVSEAEIDQYIKDNSIKIPEGQEATYKEQVKNQIEQEKLSSAASEFITSLRNAAKIKYFVEY